MLSGRATAPATAAYAKRFTNLPRHFRKALGIEVSSIGIGTYLGEPDAQTDRDYTTAVMEALTSGINLVDSAINYRFQRSERSIGKALAELCAAGRIRREEVVLATKGGYLTFDGEFPPDPRAYFQERFIATGLIAPDELVDDSHCIAPRYLDAMLERSRENLGVETIDVYYLHNPESQLAGVSREEFLVRMRAAFEMLEARAADGRIGVYGAATWNGFRSDPRSPGYLSLRELVGLAEEAGGQSHHFRMIQLPFNLAMPEALTLSNQAIGDGQGSILEAAKRMGVAVCASAALLQGRLARSLPAIVGEAMEGCATDAQRSIQFVRSTPGVDVALVGMKTAAHVRENLETARRPPAPQGAFQKLFQKPAAS